MARPELSPAFTPLQKRLHWVVAALLALQFFVFDGMGLPFRKTVEAGAPVYSPTVYAHMAIGLAVFALAAWRLLLRARNGAPEAPASEPAIFRLASKAVHAGFYVLLLALPVGGLAAWFLPSRELGELHEVGTNLLLLLAAIHVGAVVVHQFWWKTGLLRRMT